MLEKNDRTIRKVAINGQLSLIDTAAVERLNNQVTTKLGFGRISSQTSLFQSKP